MLHWYIYPAVSGWAPFTYLWDFGDSTTSTQQYPMHNYAYAGHHTISFTITDATNCTSTFIDSSSVHRPMESAAMQSVEVVDTNVTTGIVKHDALAIREWPNPVSDALNISFSRMQPEQFLSPI